jgi:spore maturation protein CgeB
MKIAFYGSSLLSSRWNGAATYYRGMIRALSGLGYRTTFFEPDILERQSHRDIEPPEWCDVVVYQPNPRSLLQAAEQCANADIVVKASGVGYADDALFELLLRYTSSEAVTIFWDVDAPATLAGLRSDASLPLRGHLARVDRVLTYGGGEAIAEGYRAFGVSKCTPIYNALDPVTHFPVAQDRRFAADLALLANRLPDREARIEEFLFSPATTLPRKQFLLGGSGWEDKTMPTNLRLLGHVGTADHNGFNASSMAILNVNRESMARIGFSPATRIFETAGAGACLITDSWTGLDLFLKEGSEVLVARDGKEVAECLLGLDWATARKIGARARERILREHTYSQRAAQFHAVMRSERGTARLEAAL